MHLPRKWSRRTRRVAATEDRPPSWCVGHHARKTWGDGSGTDLQDGVLICPRHHRVVHAKGWEIRFINGIPEYIPPASIDPQRRPQRNNRYRPQAA